MSIIYEPARRHDCGPNDYGISLDWFHDAEGTVRKCACGKTWIAYRDARDIGFMGVKWREEGRFARWRRARKARRAA